MIKKEFDNTFLGTEPGEYIDESYSYDLFYVGRTNGYVIKYLGKINNEFLFFAEDRTGNPLDNGYFCVNVRNEIKKYTQIHISHIYCDKTTALFNPFTFEHNALSKNDAYEILNARNQESCPFMRFRKTVPFVKSDFYQQHCDLKHTDYRSNLFCRKRSQNCLQMLLNECKQIIKS